MRRYAGQAVREPAPGFSLNSLVENAGSLYLLAANDINAGGQIVGLACVLAAGACGADLVGFARPDYRWSAARARGKGLRTTRSIPLSPEIWSRLTRRYTGVTFARLALTG